MMPTAIVAYLVLFALVGFLFVFGSLFLGKLLRAHAPTPMKLDVYECGEPAIGPGGVQFDLRFYVVALLFLVFEVEVALFFPTATIFGKATQVLNPNLEIVSEAVAKSADDVTGAQQPHRRFNSTVVEKYRELGVPMTAMPSPKAVPPSKGSSGLDISQQVTTEFGMLAVASMLDLGIFFAVLLVGFAFVWSRGDLDWVRAVRHPPTPAETVALVQRFRSDTSR